LHFHKTWLLVREKTGIRGLAGPGWRAENADPPTSRESAFFVIGGNVIKLQWSVWTLWRVLTKHGKSRIINAIRRQTPIPTCHTMLSIKQPSPQITILIIQNRIQMMKVSIMVFMKTGPGLQK